MGCWNETCMLSGLPIFYGEKCYAVMLIENPKYNHSCYATNSYIPVAFLSGTYDDYGSLESVDAELGKYIIEALKTLPMGIAGWQSEQFEPFDSVEAGIPWVISEARHDNFCVQLPEKYPACGYNKSLVSIRFVFLKAALVDGMLDDLKTHCSPYSLDSHFRDDPFRVDPEKLAQAALNFKTPKTEHPLINLSAFPAEVQESMLFTEQFKELREAVLFQNHNLIAAEFIRNLLTISNGDRAVCEMYAQIIRLNCLLDRMRKAWHIPSGAGSQNGYDPIYSVFLKNYREVMESILFDSTNGIEE